MRPVQKQESPANARPETKKPAQYEILAGYVAAPVYQAQLSEHEQNVPRNLAVSNPYARENATSSSYLKRDNTTAKGA
ncbi:hypothetical protein C0J08_14545 [Marinomonas sp. CT5]|uniref:hypothetical protein n=1 Tax=Marinomonas sp. CT5 TaxID=2066133 RepID=UPI001BAFDBB6|nr:hypothetical protein [Marinomonas sp. CT5]QUX96542.1 hypothetical protein C0J08_14545 [Marinomonas sp. CT5]